jgi:hypothetical protein
MGKIEPRSVRKILLEDGSPSIELGLLFGGIACPFSEGKGGRAIRLSFCFFEVFFVELF